MKFLSILKWEIPRLSLNKTRNLQNNIYLSIYQFRSSLRAKFSMLCCDNGSADWEVAKL